MPPQILVSLFESACYSSLMDWFKFAAKAVAVCAAIMFVVYWLRQFGLMDMGVWGPH